MKFQIIFKLDELDFSLGQNGTEFPYEASFSRAEQWFFKSISIPWSLLPSIHCFLVNKFFLLTISQSQSFDSSWLRGWTTMHVAYWSCECNVSFHFHYHWFNHWTINFISNFDKWCPRFSHTIYFHWLNK